MSNEQPETIINDINTMKEILSSKCDYPDDNIIILTGSKATQNGIKGIFDAELSEKINENDRLLVFYSGHGESRKAKGKRPEKGYLTTYDTQPGGDDGVNWQTMLEMDAFIPYVEERISARQTLFFIDCCFSGMIHQPPKYATHRMNLCPKDMRESTKKKSCQVYTAGGKDETVLISSNVHPPISIFVEAIKRRLEKIDPREYPENFLAASKFADKVTVQAKEISINLHHTQNPTYYFLTNDEGGEFVFKQFSEEEIENAQQRPTATQEPIEIFIQNNKLVNFFVHGNINAINRKLEADFPNGYSLTQLWKTVSTIINNAEDLISYMKEKVEGTEFRMNDVARYMIMNTLAIRIIQTRF